MILGNDSFSKVVIYVGAKDTVCFYQSELTKSNFAKVDVAVMCSGPIPMQHGRLWYNCWKFRWCTKNYVGFKDNCSRF